MSRVEQADRASSRFVNRWEQQGSVLDAVSVGIVVCGPQAEVQFCNKTGRSLLGLAGDLPPDSPLERLTEGWIGEDGSSLSVAQWVRQAIREAISTEIAMGAAIRDVVVGAPRFHAETPTVTWLKLGIQPLLTVSGAGAVCTLIDITDQRKAEEQGRSQLDHLQQQLDQRTMELRTFVNALPDHICAIEQDGQRYALCNDRVASNMAQPPQNLEGKLIVAARDMAELVLAQQALKERTEQLEAINSELESFSYSVSHDLRAPLRHISGFVAALSDRLSANGWLDDPKVAHYLNVIQSSSRKMGLLIDGLLNLSRVTRRSLVQRPVSLRPLVERAIALATSPSQPDPPVEFVIGELPTVLGDAALLQQVFANLIDNAVKFSRPKPQARIEIGCLPDYTLFVRDNGVGFPPEFADQIFGAFQRLHPEQEFEGMGIGLALVQRIILRHGGKIWAESQPGQGSTLYFTLQRASEADQTPASTSGSR